ncbi:phage tail protein [Calothrix parasitica NIES-267]|uniref:Phage tail protein n=1 Tax=Calothrix parasitica NIES-267 TaxID=1973488 RepID=A0A1Z4LK14_9CYAN|nr:phage tail protein [Calothrix parasitica NIES-267]
MVQTPPLAIQLASMRLPEAIESSSLSIKFSKVKLTEREDNYNNNLLLYPDEAEEILVTVENTSSIHLRCSIDVGGDYPAKWLKSKHNNLNFDISPNQKKDKLIQFKVDSDFFENQDALSDKAKLQLNYKVQIQLYSRKLWFNNIPIKLWFLLLNRDARASILFIRSFQERQIKSRLIEYQFFNLLVRPRTSYLDFLPSIFGENDGGRRLVSIFEQAFDPVVQTTDVLWAYFDPLTAPEAFLPFLAKWVGWEIDKRWTVGQQRRLIRNAVTLYRWHGTKHGLRLYLHYYTDLPLDEDLEEESEKHISIQENFNDGFVVGEANVNKNPMLGGGKPYHFTVRLRTDTSNQLDEELVREIIERYKPAFSTYELSIDSVHY